MTGPATACSECRVARSKAGILIRSEFVTAICNAITYQLGNSLLEQANFFKQVGQQLA
jgi:hypothetical protein